MDETIKALLNYGVLGIVVIGLAYWIKYLSDQAREERKEWQKLAEKINESQNKNTDILSALKTLIETTREKK